MDKETEQRSCLKYVDTVAFFSVFYRQLGKEGIEVTVEHDFQVPEGPKVRPDFAILDGVIVPDILEHKASLPEPGLATDELNSVSEKYSKIQSAGKVSTPQVTLLYPIEKQEIIEAIGPQMPASLTLCSFDQTVSHTEIRFKLRGPVRYKPLESMIEGPPLTFRPERVLSKHKFIRATPPAIYTAFEIWLVLPTFRLVRTAHERSFLVSRENLLRRTLVFYPPWIRNNVQINANRINRALQFLDKIDFVDWTQGQDEIVVYSTRGTRTGDLLRYFSEKWAQHVQKGKLREIASTVEIQPTLASFDEERPS